MHCRLTPASSKLSEAMDVVLITKHNGFSLLWNDERRSRSDLIELFSGDSLNIVIYPYDTEEFFSITDDFPVTVEYQNYIRDPSVVSISPCLHLTVLEKNSDEQLTYENEPLEKILYVDDLKDLRSIDDASLPKMVKKKPLQSEIENIYDIVNRKSVVVLTIPIENINRDDQMNYFLQFTSKSVIYKYYFTSLSANDDFTVEPEQSPDTVSTISFSQSEPYLDQGTYVPTFISDSPIKLTDQPETHYRLIQHKNGTEEVLIDTLPQPKIGQFYKHVSPQQDPITVLEAFIN
jgi:hypothetical protein